MIDGDEQALAPFMYVQQPLRARFQPVGFIGLQAGFRLVEPKSLQLGERGGFALSFQFKSIAFLKFYVTVFVKRCT
jgi:hypothetical protein